jgi:hypothetical protein
MIIIKREYILLNDQNIHNSIILLVKYSKLFLVIIIRIIFLPDFKIGKNIILDQKLVTYSKFLNFRNFWFNTGKMIVNQLDALIIQVH